VNAGSPRSLADEVLARCDRLALCTEEPGRITRPFLCPSAKEVHGLVGDWMREAGMVVEVDSIGNIVGYYRRSRADGPEFLIGSHLDTVPNAGRYDGILGVLLGIAAVKRLAGARLPFGIQVAGFSEEEGIRFRTSYLGSKVWVGKFEPEQFERLDGSGISLRKAISDFGLDPEEVNMQQIGVQQIAVPQYLGYLEAHIEQGPVLEAANLPLGVVEAIAGQSRLWLRFDGKAGHAGTEPMTMRRDALVAASEFVVSVDGMARGIPGLVATVGSLAVASGAVNVVPGSVRFSLDVRHGDDATRERAVAKLLEIAAAIGHDRRCSFHVERREQHAATKSNDRLTSTLAAAAESLGHLPLRMVSGAGHDAVVMAGVCPMTMLFVRSIGGISHHPDEAVHPADVHAALDVMVAFLERLAGEPT
jgi:allantoate deiminase